MLLCVGLFGTCGRSIWRTPVMDRYNDLKINYFNPQKADWKPEDAVVEADHLANDAVILFPITSETYATGSLAEVGFSILNAIKLDSRRDFVVMIDQKLDKALMEENPAAAKESLRARALVLQHLKKLALSNVYLVDNLDDLMKVGAKLYMLAEIRQEELAKFSLGK